MSESYMDRDYIEIAKEWFDQHLGELLSEHRGKWAAIRLDTLIGIYDSYEEAYSNGVSKAKSEEILIRRVVDKKDDKPAEISVNITLGLLNGSPSFSGTS